MIRDSEVSPHPGFSTNAVAAPTHEVSPTTENGHGLLAGPDLHEASQLPGGSPLPPVSLEAPAVETPLLSIVVESPVTPEAVSPEDEELLSLPLLLLLSVSDVPLDSSALVDEAPAVPLWTSGGSVKQPTEANEMRIAHWAGCEQDGRDMERRKSLA